MKIGIIGTGVSALYLSMHLAEQEHQVDIFGAETSYGGNMNTAEFELDGVQRFADVGVNDFNTVTYKRLIHWLDKLGVEYRPLEDTTCFFDIDKTFAYSTDGTNNTAMPPDVAADFQRFQTEAPIDARHPDYAKLSIGEYVNLKAYGDAFIRTNLLPRINAMYYCHDTGAASMPFRAVMIYYALQEGFGGPPAQRMYFAQGCKSWADALTHAATRAGVKFHLGALPQVYANGESVKLKLADGQADYDAVIFTTHAGSIINTLREGLTPTDMRILAEFRYFNSRAYVHQDASLLPANANAWRTYNVASRNVGDGLTPYSITYVENRHQNDANNPNFDHYRTPTFFTTLNPLRPIQPELILRDLSNRPIVTHFSHNTLDINTFSRQKYVHDNLQGRAGLFYAGGWSKGAGLQEECLLAADFVLEKIHSASAQDPHLWEHERDETGIPTYFMNATTP